MPGEIPFTLNVKSSTAATTAPPPPTEAFAFDTKTGRLLARAPVDAGSATLQLPAQTAGLPVNFVVGPPHAAETPAISDLAKLGAVQTKLTVNTAEPVGHIVADPARFLLCPVVVHGRV